MDSIWTKSASLPHFEALQGSVNTDVLIIGGGITGILCAHFLQEQGVDYVLAEGRTICSGVTENTTAKLTCQHGLIFSRLVKCAGIEKAKMYLEANQIALNKYFTLCQEIDCGFEEKTAFVYSLDNIKKLEKEADALRLLGQEAQITEASKLPFPTAGAIAFKHQAQFHPLKFLSMITASLNIYEHTFITELSENTAVTDKGRITFNKLIFATHFPIDNKHGLYFLKMYQRRSYCIALENAAEIDGMYIDEAKDGMSFRNYKNLLIVGGGGHRTGKSGGGWQELRDFAAKHYPGSTEKYSWAAQDCMTLDGVPYIGKYSKNMPECFVATGFNKWGMTSSMAAAMILADMVMEKENPYADVFNPSRNMIKPQLLCNGLSAAAGLLTLSTKRCPHLGCALKWNDAEHSWDCSCHGSRFDAAGRLLNNPANGDIDVS